MVVKRGATVAGFLLLVTIGLAQDVRPAAPAASPAQASATGKYPTLYGWMSGRHTHRIGFSAVRMGGPLVKRVKRGVYNIYLSLAAYQFGADFHFVCPGLHRRVPTDFNGIVEWRVRLRPGTCRYFSTLRAGLPRRQFGVFDPLRTS
jgi:hypothetical protein